MNQNAMIGAHIRNLRLAKKLTLKQLSDASGLSVGFLSQLERGMSSIAIDTLARLAHILGADLSSFFNVVQGASHDPVVHGFDLKAAPVSPQIIQYVLSNDPLGFEMLPRLFLLMPMDALADEQIEMYSHDGEEFTYVLEGIVTVYVDGVRHTLYPGDSIHIRSNLPHNWVNLTTKPARLLSINAPNPFKGQE
jgi:transcriptional regulator with XRE-family HTH domain